MRRFANLEILTFTVVLLLHQLFTSLLRGNLTPIYYPPPNFFAADLLGINLPYDLWFIYLSENLNLILIFVVSRKFFKGTSCLVAPVIYAISPWNSYLAATGSFYIFLLTITLTFCFGLIKLKSNRKVSLLLLSLSTIAAAFSSALLFTILLLSLFLLILLKVFKASDLLNNLKFAFACLVLVFALIVFNKTAAANIFSKEVAIFKDPGFSNNVNAFQGEAAQAGLSKLAKISENKYILAFYYITSKALTQVMPSTIFSQNEKLLYSSFAPPIYLGFLPVFCYGLYLSLKSSSLRKLLLTSILLLIPSVLAQNYIALNRLVLISPVVIFLISYGLITLESNRKSKLAATILLATIFLVLVQMTLVISDIQLKEQDRFTLLRGKDFDIRQ